MKKLLYFLTAFLLCGNLTLFGQERIVTGVVTSAEDSIPLPGVTVLIKGTSSVAVTDANGKYSIKSPGAGSAITFSFIGFKTANVEIGAQSSIDVVLLPDVIGVDEVVVTALGIQKKARSLTYSTQQISGSDLNSAKDANPLNALGGKTAGLVIGRSTSGVGGSSRLIIRGTKSINSENQPLYVIDGIPINGSTMGGNSSAYGTFDGGDVISNINSEDIESINVLKGAAASALYGSLGQNGVVLISTKKGTSGVTTVEFSNTLTFDQAMKSLYPELQGEYGTVPLSYADLTANKLETWGPRDSTSSTGGFLDELFSTGVNNISNVSITTGNSKNQLYVSFGNTTSKGIIEQNTMSKNNFYIKGNSKLTDKFTLDASATLTLQEVENRPMGGFYHNPILDSYLWPNSDDSFKYYKENFEKFDARKKYNVQNDYPYRNIGPSYITDLPYWTINRKPNELKRGRDIYTCGLRYEFTKEFNVSSRVSYDKTNDSYYQRIYASSSNGNTSPNGGYAVKTSKSDQIYSDLLLAYSTEKLTNFTINATAGASNTYSNNYFLTLDATNGDAVLSIPNLFNIYNLKDKYIKYEDASRIMSQAVFGAFTLGWKNMLFFDATGRNEWSSTVIDCNPNNFFYPSVGGTFVLSELTGANSVLSFAKLRATYSEVGNALPYGVNRTFENQKSVVTTTGTTAPDASIPQGSPLKPERSKSIELGANIRLFNNSIDFDVTYYDNQVENQFLSVPAESGFKTVNKLINAGQISNKGVEVMLTYKAAPSKDFSFSSSVNFAYNKNKIVSLYKGSDTMMMADYKDAQINLVTGNPMGDIFSTDFERDSLTGKIIVADGSPKFTAKRVKVGNVNSPLSIGWSNSITYQRITFKFLIEGKFGGDVYSRTEVDLDATGRSKRSGDARNAGFVMFEGDTVAFGATNVQKWFTEVSKIGGNYIYDATNVRLREVSLGYDIPVGFSNGVLKKLNLSVYGRNLLFFAIHAPFDPEMSAGTSIYQQGIEMYSLPSTRTFGFSLRATF